MKPQPFLLGTILFLGLHFAHAAPQLFVCPQSIPEASVHLLAPAKEWKMFVASPIYLHSAAPADGPPERLGILRGDDPRTTRTGTTQIYSLVGRYPEGKWLRCDYGSFGQISMAKRLPDETKECTVKKRKGEHAGENQVEIRCL